MSAPQYSLSINDAAPVATHLLNSCKVMQRTCQNQGMDSLTLRFRREAVAASPLADGSKVIVYLDGVPFFTGWVPIGRSVLSMNQSVMDVTLMGPWHWFQQYTMARFSPYYDETSPAIDNGVTLHQSGTPVVIADVNTVLSAQNTMGYPIDDVLSYLTFQQQLEEVIEYVRLQTVREFGAAAFQVGTISLPTLYGPLVSVADAKAEVHVRNSLAAYPDAALWFDYSTSPPTLNCGVMSAAVEQAISLSDLDLSKLDVTARHDMQVTGVVIRYDSNPPDLTAWPQNRGTFNYPAGTQMNNAGVFTKSFSVGSGYVPNTPYNDLLTAQLYGALSNLVIEGPLSFKAGSPRLDAHPGKAWALSGGTALTDGGKLWTQATSDDLASGMTTCTLGFPKRLGIEDLRTLSDRIRLTINLG